MREESLQNIQNNQYVSGGTGAMNLMYFAFGNPITDSMVVNAYAKTNSAAFEMGLKTGIYNNHTVAGGNFLYNTLNNNRFTGKLFKNAKTGSFKPFKNFKFLNENGALRNLSFNFLSSADIENTAVTKIAEKTGLNKTSEIVRTGWGFGRDYKGFFGALKDAGYTGNNFSIGTDEARKNISNFIRSMDDDVFNRFASALDKIQLKNLNRIRSGQKKTVNDAIIRALDAFSKTDDSILDFTSKTLSKDVLSSIVNATDEQVIKLADEFLKIGGNLNSYTRGATIATKELREELAEAIGKKIAGRTTFQKIISSPLVRIATGAAVALPASVAIPLAVVTTGIGITASVGQENAVNNFINSHLYNETQYERYSSEESMSSLYSASNIRDVNLQALANAYRDVNVANRYLNDMDSISSDYKYTLDDAETI